MQGKKASKLWRILHGTDTQMIPFFNPLTLCRNLFDFSVSFPPRFYNLRLCSFPQYVYIYIFALNFCRLQLRFGKHFLQLLNYRRSLMRLGINLFSDSFDRCTLEFNHQILIRASASCGGKLCHRMLNFENFFFILDNNFTLCF